MNSLVVFSVAVLALAAGAPQGPPGPPAEPAVYIVSQDAYVHPDGYTFQFETSDGTARSERGSLRAAAGAGGTGGAEGVPTLAVRGAYRYVSPDGAVHSVQYVADEHGFQPTDHVVDQ